MKAAEPFLAHSAKSEAGAVTSHNLKNGHDTAILTLKTAVIQTAMTNRIGLLCAFATDLRSSRTQSTSSVAVGIINAMTPSASASRWPANASPRAAPSAAKVASHPHGKGSRDADCTKRRLADRHRSPQACLPRAGAAECTAASAQRTKASDTAGVRTPEIAHRYESGPWVRPTLTSDQRSRRPGPSHYHRSDVVLRARALRLSL
jgi:hypothetical protein